MIPGIIFVENPTLITYEDFSIKAAVLENVNLEKLNKLSVHTVKI